MFERNAILSNGETSFTMRMTDFEQKPFVQLCAASEEDATVEETDDTMSTVSSDGSSSALNDDVVSTSIPPPKGFVCPLTMEVMYDPVLDAEGNTYERSAILEWLKKEKTSPISRQPLSEQMLNPNNALRESIHEIMGDAWVKARADEYASTSSGHSGTLLCSHATPLRSSKSKFRAKMDCFLQLASSEFQGLPCALNENGCCAFRHDDITMVLDVPESIGVFCLYTCSLVPALTEPMKDLLLELNFLQGDTRGGCLSVKRNNAGQPEVMFSYTDRVTEISARDFCNVIANFTQTAVKVRNKLCDAGQQSLR